MRKWVRVRKEKTLNQVAVELLQGLALLGGFDAFSNELNAKLLREGHGRLHDGVDHGVLNLLGKLLVEFDHIKR